MASTNDTEHRLFVVYLKADSSTSAQQDLDMMPLAEDLWLVRSSLTLSKLYHRIKHAADPVALFVGLLDDQPKFKGMAEGSLKWLRSGD